MRFNCTFNFSHFEPVNENVGRCHKNQMEANKCFGGAARIKAAADGVRNEKPDMPSIFLNAGDFYQVIYKRFSLFM